MATHLQLSFMKVILFANEGSPTTVGLERRRRSFRFDCGLYFWVLNNRLFYLLDSIKWLPKLERGWGGVGVGGCQVENEVAVCRRRLNSVFNAWRVGKGVRSKRDRNEAESGWACGSARHSTAEAARPCLNQSGAVPPYCLYFILNPSGHQWKGKMKIPLKVSAQREEITKADWRNKSGMSKEEAGLLQQQNIFASLWLHLIYLGSILARCYTHSNTEATVEKEKLPFDRKKPWAELCSKDGVPSPRGQLRWIIKGVRHCCSFFFFF